MPSPVDVVACGARTPLGLHAAPAAAAVRAGISALGEHPFMVGQVGDPMMGALDAQLDPRLMGPERLVSLADAALRHACVPIAASGLDRRLHLPVYVALPELRPGFGERDAAAVRAGIARLGGLPISMAELHVLPAGHAAGLAALAMAVDRIRAGVYEACLVGGVDSYFQPDTMEWLDANRQLAGAVSRSGFVPGEGAAFCLLMSPAAREARALPSRARVLAVALGRETKLIKTDAVCLGEGLTATVRTAVEGAVEGAGARAERIGSVICDMNSERYRAEEWGFVCLRLGQHFDAPTTYLSPADCWGDVGAASGPLFLMLACEAATRGWARGPRTLVWASSELGLRGAAVLEHATVVGAPTPERWT